MRIKLIATVLAAGLETFTGLIKKGIEGVKSEHLIGMLHSGA